MTAVVNVIQTKHEEKMLALWEMIKKSLLFRDSASSTRFPDPNASSKAFLLTNLWSKATIRWNWSDLGYLDSHLNRAHGKGKIMLVGKDVYHKNVVLFIQRFQSLITFKEAALIKANVVTSL